MIGLVFTKPFLLPFTIPYRLILRNVVKNVIKSILMYNDVDFISSLRRKDGKKIKKRKRHHVPTVTNKSIREVRL